jgi:hypothetical protein
MKSLRRSASPSLAVLLSALPCLGLAHHSAAMFDTQRRISVSGAVRQFQWMNPHCWIELDVQTARGIEKWSIEMGSPADIFRGGWKPGTLRAGDRIRVVLHPVREAMLRGTVHAGSFVSATGPTGEPIESAAQR